MTVGALLSFGGFLTSGMSLELLSFAWCSLLCLQKLIVLLPSKYVLF